MGGGVNKKEYRTATLNPGTFLPPDDKTIKTDVSNPIYFKIINQRKKDYQLLKKSPRFD